MIGTMLLNRYRLDAELGRGGMGVIYHAHDMLLGRSVAVKLLSESGLGSEGRTRLLHEAQAAARLNHPNIVTVHDVGEADKVPFIVMELVDGKPLDVLQIESLSGKIAIARQICAALEHAHTNGVIHRDLKPENILILASPVKGQGADVRVKLMDFGLAQTADTLRLAENDEIVGTFFYIAPEIIQGQPASPQSDLYALGVMLYELVAGRPPFTGDNLMTLASQQLYAPVIPPSTYNAEIPAPLDMLIVQLLSKNPQDRPASASALLQTFERLSQDNRFVPGQSVVEPVSMLERIARGRFVARQPEIAEALRFWQQAAQGEGRVLLISGEPGVGKTRFARELIVHTQMTGAIGLLGECFAEGTAPYAPIAQMIASTDLSGMPASIVADLLTIAPVLRTAYPDVPPNPMLDAPAERQRIFDNVAAFFALLSERAPVVLFIDDVHWADSGSLFLLHNLARRARSMRMLIVLTYREVELREARPLHEMLLDFNREHLATRIKLLRFDREQTGALLAVLFQEKITPEFITGVYSETEGNPFFIEEVCKALIESGTLYREGGRWRWPGMDQIEIPQSVRVAVELRVAKLAPRAQDILRAAAVLGREFEFAVLHAMDDLDEETLIDALEIAERAQLIAETRREGVPSFTFVHALIPLTLLEGMSTLRRQRLHRRAAQAIERVHAGQLPTGNFAAALSHHYAEAGDSEKAGEQYLLAAERARSVYAYHEAIGHAQNALTLLKDSGPAKLTQAARTAMTLGQLYHTVFDFEHSQQAYQDGFALWQRDEEEHRKMVWSPAPHALRLFGGAIKCLDLTRTNWAHNHAIIGQLFSGLVECTPELDIVPDLALSWDVQDQGRRYVFHLRPDARWSDGRSVTSQDFEYTWKFQLNPTNGSLSKELFYDLKNARACYEGRALPEDVGVRASDDLTLVVELEEPVGHFLHVLANTATFAVPRHVVEAYGPQWATPAHIVTNGPFGLETWQPDERIVLARNPAYRGRRRGNLNRVDITLSDRRIFEDLLQAYAADASDAMRLLPWEVEGVRRQHASELVRKPIAHSFFIFFCIPRPPFDDVRVRQALAHAIDRVKMVNTIYDGLYEPALGGIVPPGMPGYSPGIGLLYDPGRARRLLAEAGYPGGHAFPSIGAYIWETGNSLLPQYLQQQWQEVLGINIQCKLIAWENWQEQRLEPATHLVANGWKADYPDPHNFLCEAPHLFVPGWCSAEYEHLLEVARHTSDSTERIKIYQAAERILIQEAAILPLAYLQRQLLVKPWVKRYPVSSLGTSYWKDVIIEQH